MDAVYFHPAGHKHHFRNVEPKDGKADLHDDDGKPVFKDVPVSAEPKVGCVVINGYQLKNPAKSAKVSKSKQ